jgi:hypothetical protein
VIEGRAFHRWTGVVPPGGSIRLVLPTLTRTPVAVLAGLVAAVGLVLALAAWRILRGDQAGPPPAPPPDPDQVLDAIATLDARYAGKEGETPADEWQQYQSERARLKAELASSLAMRSAGR